MNKLSPGDLATKLARAVFATGDLPTGKCARIEFKIGEYPNEVSGCGLGESSLRSLLCRVLLQCEIESHEFPVASLGIRPLKWKKTISPYWEYHQADVPMGSYTVERSREDWEESKPWKPWQMKYLFDEHHDEGSIACESLKDVKEKAWKDWQERIIPALIPMRQAMEKK